ncbi:hypothetical protein FG386_000251 [Cryptosporidium ryanae]|uniref:uncharacterized protein n=1 Tax=Cryptosporidium ryanae TaxID=515981 RepID=UPI00351A7402|nr:hypothetical protein FG386_000251 [Cryptosporidium ryanae]
MDQHQILLQNKIVKTTFAIKSKEAAIQSIQELDDENVYREVSRMFIKQSKPSLKMQLEKELDDLKTLLSKMKALEASWESKQKQANSQAGSLSNSKSKS